MEPEWMEAHTPEDGCFRESNRSQNVNEKTSKDGSLDQTVHQLKKRNARFEQEVADSRDHAKQSGRGKGANKLIESEDKSGEKS